MRKLISVILILTALSLQAQVVPNATNADNLGGTGATNYITVSGAAEAYLSSSSGPIIYQNIVGINALDESTATLRIDIDTNTISIGVLEESTATLRIDVDANETAIGVVEDSTATLRVDVDDNKAVIEELSSSTDLFYYTNKESSSEGYLIMVDTKIAGAESTIIKTLDSATVIVATFTIETPLDISAFRAGLYHSHFHAKVDNATKDTRLRFEVYEGTDTTEAFLFSSEQSNLQTTDKSVYNIHTSTNEILGTVGYLVIKIVADVTGGGPNPVLTFYMEGTNSSLFEMPSLLSDVGVTKIIPGTNMNITSPNNNGRGEVTINLNLKPQVENITASVEGSFNEVVSSNNIYANKDVVHGRDDANTKLDFGNDQIALVAGSKDVIRGIEAAVDTICVGDGTWVYMIFGDSTNFINEVTTYTYSTKLWSMINLAIRYGIHASSFRFTIGGTVDAGGIITGDPDFINKPLTVTMGSSSTDDFDTNEYANDNLCLQAALTYLSTSTTSGGTIQVLDGAFTFEADNGIIETKCDNVRIVGNGRGTKFTWNDNENGDAIFFGRHSGFSMSNIYHKTIVDDNSNMVMTFSSANVILTNININNCWFETDNNGNSTFLSFSDCKTVHVTKNQFKAFGADVFPLINVIRSSNVVISKNIGEGPEGSPFWVFANVSGELITISDNILQRLEIKLSGGEGIDICTIADNTLEFRGTNLDNDLIRGIHIALNKASNDIKIQGNTIINKATGIDQLPSSANIDNITIVGNRINCSTGVTLASDARYCQIQGNNFKGCILDIQDAGTGTQITNNIDEAGNKDRNPMVGTELDLTSGATFQHLNVQSITSGDAGTTGQIWTQNTSSPSWNDPAAGGGGGVHNIPWHITGYPFNSDSTDTGLYIKTTAIAGTITEVHCKMRIPPSESFDIRFKHTAQASTSYDNIFGTATFTLGIGSVSVTGLSIAVGVGDCIGLDMYNIAHSSNAGQDVGATVKLEE